MKKSIVLGALLGFTIGTAVAIAGKMAVDKVIDEIKHDLHEQSFVSPEGDHIVTISCGSSAFANGLTHLRLKALFPSGEDDCKLSILTRKAPQELDTQWQDNDHFQLLVGNGKHKQCCDVSFEEKQIIANYYWVRNR